MAKIRRCYARLRRIRRQRGLVVRVLEIPGFSVALNSTPLHFVNGQPPTSWDF